DFPFAFPFEVGFDFEPGGQAPIVSPWRRCAGTAFRLTVIVTNGFVLEPVWWQIVTFSAVVVVVGVVVLVDVVVVVGTVVEVLVVRNAAEARTLRRAARKSPFQVPSPAVIPRTACSPPPRR